MLYRIRWPDDTESVSQAGTVSALDRATVRRADGKNERTSRKRRPGPHTQS